MKQHKLKYPAEKICEVLGVSSSGYYRWLKNGPSKHWLENQKIISAIEDIFNLGFDTFSPKTHNFKTPLVVG